MRLSVAMAVACLSISILPAAEPVQAAVRQSTNIPAQALGTALQALARQRAFQVVYLSDAVDTMKTEGACGDLMPDEALKQLLSGTGLTYRYLDESTVTVYPADAPQAMNGNSGALSGLDPIVPGAGVRLAQNTPSTDSQSSKKSQSSSSSSGESADASESRTQLEEIVVTAQKRVERLQDVPVPVTALNAQTLASNNQLRLQDYYSKIPGMTLGLSGNGGEPVLIIRGIATAVAEGTNPTVGVVVDEVSFGSSVATGAQTPAIVDIDPSDLSRVEVLRGPQGTLYGASSIGGLLKFVTVDPSTEAMTSHVQVGGTSVSHGSDVGYSVRGAVNVPVNDTLAVRVSGFTRRDPGYIDNAETGERDVNDRNSDGGRLSALWSPSDTFSLKLSALIQETERNGTDDVDTTLGGVQQEFLPGSGTYRRNTEAYNATLTARLGQVDLVSATGFSDDKLRDSVDFTTAFGTFFGDMAQLFFGVPREVTIVENNVEKFTQELRASIPLGARVNWLLGAFYTHEETFRFTDNMAADSTGAIAGSLFKTTFDVGKFEERAAFTNFTFDITDRWDIQVGGRISNNRQVFPSVTTGPLVPILIEGASSPLTVPDLESQDSAFTYLVTPRLRISPDLMVYARLASGYRPGGPNPACGQPRVPCEFDPDTTRNYDVGIKGNLPGRALSFDASLYYIDWNDIQIPGIRAGAFIYTGNASRAKSQGVELSVESRPLTGLTLSAWAAYNEAELTEAFPLANLSGRRGDRLPYSSRFSANLSLDQEFPLWGVTSGFLGGSLSYVGDRQGNFQPVDVTRETFPSYTLLNLHAGFRYDTWALNVFVNNVADKRGVLRGGLDAVIFPNYFTYIQPRTIGLSLAKDF